MLFAASQMLMFLTERQDAYRIGQRRDVRSGQARPVISLLIVWICVRRCLEYAPEVHRRVK
jgi:hypothetical protein